MTNLFVFITKISHIISIYYSINSNCSFSSRLILILLIYIKTSPKHVIIKENINIWIIFNYY